jgi:hypothetical protein
MRGFYVLVSETKIFFAHYFHGLWTSAMMYFERITHRSGPAAEMKVLTIETCSLAATCSCLYKPKQQRVSALGHIVRIL